MKPRYLEMLRKMTASGPENSPADWSVYILECAGGTLYTGVAKDVAQRLKKHQDGKGAAYTRTRRPVRLLYSEAGLTRSAALVREAEIKSWPPKRKRGLIGAGRVS